MSRKIESDIDKETQERVKSGPAIVIRRFAIFFLSVIAIVLVIVAMGALLGRDVIEAEGLVNSKASPNQTKETPTISNIRSLGGTQDNADRGPPPTVASSPTISRVMKTYVGKHPSKVLNDNTISERFKEILGPSYAVYKEHLQVASEIVKDKDWYFGKGCRPHFCGSDGAAFAIHETDNRIVVILKQQGTYSTFYNKNDSKTLMVLRDWYFNGKPMSVTDLVLDYSELGGKEVVVSGWFTSVGELKYLADSTNRSVFLMIDESELAKTGRRKLLTECSKGCEVLFVGTVEPVFLQKGLRAIELF